MNRRLAFVLVLALAGPHPAFAQVVEQENTKFSGFVDLRFRDVNSSLKGQGRGAESGFLMEDAAFYLQHSSGRISLLIDLPFSRQKETVAGSGGPQTPFYKSSGPDLEFATRKAQVVGSYQVRENFKLSLGQFDTLFGYEVNDSRDRFFGQTGLLYNDALPVTHVGLLAEWTLPLLTAKLMAVNPNGRGSRDDVDAQGQSTTNGEDNTEYGATVGGTWGPARAQVGYLTRPRLAYDSKRSRRTLLDVVAGVTIFQKLSLDAEWVLVNDPAKDLELDGDFDTGGEGHGYLLHATYQLNDLWRLGARLEYTDQHLGLLFETEKTWALGAHYNLQSDANLRAEYIEYDLESVLTSVPSQKLRVFSIGAMLTF